MDIEKNECLSIWIVQKQKWRSSDTDKKKLGETEKKCEWVAVAYEQTKNANCL